MLVNVNLSQVNKNEIVSFSANAKFNTGNSDSLDTLIKSVSKFCMDVQKLNERTAKLGHKSNFGFRKTHPLRLTLEGEDINTIKLEFNNFGRLLDETTETKLRLLFKYNIEFLQEHVNYNF